MLVNLEFYLASTPSSVSKVADGTLAGFLINMLVQKYVGETIHWPADPSLSVTCATVRNVSSHRSGNGINGIQGQEPALEWRQIHPFKMYKEQKRSRRAPVASAYPASSMTPEREATAAD